jgi:hypothetical protein
MHDHEFIRLLNGLEWTPDSGWQQGQPAPQKSSIPFKSVEITNDVELTKSQKEAVIKYVLIGVGKGLYEDCEEFWGEMSQEEIEEKYSSYRDAVDNFVESLKLKLLREL